MDVLALSLFVVSAVALLGSPGPGIAALLAVGRAEGLSRGLTYFTGLQVGLAIASALSAAGLFSLIGLVPGAMQVMAIASALYLLWLAWKIASAPVGVAGRAASITSSATSGFILGISNPKAYIAFVSLFASQAIVHASTTGDLLLKWIAITMVILVVDILWLLIGVGLGRARLSPGLERAFNILLGAMIVGATLLSFR
jgi:threonine/homoserine/homoserine lactone efflux protein